MEKTITKPLDVDLAFDPETGEQIKSAEQKLLVKKKIDQIARKPLLKRKKKSKERIKKIKYIGVEFEPTKIDECEKQVNDALSQGYSPIRDIDTPRGLIMVLGLWQRD
ncbi:uncharacterized protein METZ01_LOCUS390541 [marine metagenome]|uniref:Uncharacterized protein n=1 Tax=marine metagenome TaxID=408172 RepID=A0A382UU70_9ZZZZ